MVRLWMRVGAAAALVSLAGCNSSVVSSGTATTVSAPSSVFFPQMYSSPLPASSDDQVEREFCGSMVARAELPTGATATFLPAETNQFSIRVGQAFQLTATSRCGMAFLIDGQSLTETPGTVWPSAFAGRPFLFSGEVLSSPAMPNPPGTVTGNMTAVTPGVSVVSVEVDVPGQNGYLEPIAMIVIVTS